MLYIGKTLLYSICKLLSGDVETVKMWGLLNGDVVAPKRRSGGSLKEMWWLLNGDVVAP